MCFRFRPEISLSVIAPDLVTISALPPQNRSDRIMSHPVFTPTDGPVGAFVTGVDLSIPLAPYIAAAILTELGEHGVLFFRD